MSEVFFVEREKTFVIGCVVILVLDFYRKLTIIFRVL